MKTRCLGMDFSLQAGVIAAPGIVARIPVIVYSPRFPPCCSIIGAFHGWECSLSDSQVEAASTDLRSLLSARHCPQPGKN